MPKLLNTSFPTFQPGPTPSSPPKWLDYLQPYDRKKYWDTRIALTFDLKKYFYLNYISKYNCEATTYGFYKSQPFDIGDYCKGQVTVTTSSLFKVNTVNVPQFDGKPITIFANMCENVSSTWTASIMQQYRRTNSADNGGGAANVSNIVRKRRNCFIDYVWNGEKWVKVSDNPDTNFFDYTVTFNSELRLNLSRGSSFQYLDPNNYTVLTDINFGGYNNHLILKGLYDPSCSQMAKAGTLVFASKPLSSDVVGLGVACASAGGSISMNITWTPSDKLDLI